MNRIQWNSHSDSLKSGTIKSELKENPSNGRKYYVVRSDDGRNVMVYNDQIKVPTPVALTDTASEINNMFIKMRERIQVLDDSEAHESPVSNNCYPTAKLGLETCISSGITTVIHVQIYRQINDN